MTDPSLKIGIELEDRVTTGLQKIQAASKATAMEITDGFTKAGTAVTRARECFQEMGGANAEVAAGVQKVEERFHAFRQAADGLNNAVKELNDSFALGEEERLRQRERFSQ